MYCNYVMRLMNIKCVSVYVRLYSNKQTNKQMKMKKKTNTPQLDFIFLKKEGQERERGVIYYLGKKK